MGWLGEERYKQLVNFVLRYLADIECPVKRGTFVEFRYVDLRGCEGTWIPRDYTALIKNSWPSGGRPEEG